MRVPNFNELLLMLNKGVIHRVRDNMGPLPFGFRGGNYLGAPGKDIYFVLPSLKESELTELAERVADLFPDKPPSNHVAYAALVRYIYGCFEKQGTLRSEKDKKRMIKEDPDWNIPFRFMEKVEEFFVKKNKQYGLVVHYEMLAHRWGDRVVIENNPVHLEKMTELYLKSQKIAKQIGSLKHTFTPYYWAACYYAEMKEVGNAIRFHRYNIKAMEKYCPDSRAGYKEKVRESILYLKKNMSAESWDSMKKWLRTCSNKCVSKIVRKVLGKS